MKVHEYQAKALMSRYGVPIPRGQIASTPSDARRITEELGGRSVVKAQVHAGARGKAGGIYLPTLPKRPRTLQPLCWASSWSPPRLALKAPR